MHRLVPLLLLLFSVISVDARAQASVGLTLQAYPAGLITSIQGSISISPASQALAFVAWNATDRRDWGKHDNEEGGGPGAGLAWRYYFSADHSGFFAGVRTDLWFLDIDWTDTAPNRNVPDRTGTTEVTVLQPTAQIGYALPLGAKRWVLEGAAALGAEVNVRTDGEAVGEGAILLVGLGLSYRF